MVALKIKAFMSQTELLYPHEDLAGLATGSAETRLWHADRLLRTVPARLAARIGELGVFGATRLFQIGETEEFVALNGHRRGTELLCKDRFSAIVETLGYLAPRTAVARPGRDPQELLSEVAALSDQPERFLKPLWGSRAKGTMQARDPEEALAFISGTHLPYLIQRAEYTAFELRYAVHRDARQVTEDSPHGWRMAIRKIRPSVSGDGQTSLRELVRQNEAMPLPSRIKYHFHRGKDIDRVPDKDEHVELAVGGNIGASLPDKTELAHLDTFMTPMIEKLERYVGARLPTIGFDIGVRHPDTLKEPYNHDRLLKELVFYEFQVPFSFMSYIAALNSTTREEARSLSSLGTNSFRAATFLTFGNSLMASGKASSRMTR